MTEWNSLYNKYKILVNDRNLPLQSCQYQLKRWKPNEWSGQVWSGHWLDVPSIFLLRCNRRWNISPEFPTTLKHWWLCSSRSFGRMAFEREESFHHPTCEEENQRAHSCLSQPSETKHVLKWTWHNTLVKQGQSSTWGTMLFLTFWE